jgi:hypothetical protein
MSAVLAWRLKAPRPRIAGQYAGRARFQPRYVELVPDELEPAIGQIVELGFAGVATGEDIYAGQSLYLEWCQDTLLRGFVIPEQDLQFVSGSSSKPEMRTSPRIGSVEPIRQVRSEPF